MNLVVRKKPSRTTLRNKADKLFSKYIRQRDKECQASGNHVGVLQCAHLISRRYLATRFDDRNAVALCIGHHKFFTEHPIQWDTWCVFWLGLRPWESLREKAVVGGRPDYESIIEDLQDLLDIQTLVDDGGIVAGSGRPRRKP